MEREIQNTDSVQVPWLVRNKLFTAAFEQLYYQTHRKKICRKILEDDRFDGRLYGFDNFLTHASHYFERPHEFYQTTAHPESVCLRNGLHPRHTLPVPDSAEMMLFDSPFPSGDATNDVVPFKLFRRPDAPSDVLVLFVPGWGRENQRVEDEMSLLLMSRGVDVGLMTTPYHLARTPLGSYSGEYFISSNVFWTIANFRQLVSEIRVMVQLMRKRYRYIGLLGMSSGGFQTGLAAICEEVDFLFPLITGCHLGSITWQGLVTQYIRQDLEQRGIDEAALNRIWSITDLAVIGKHTQARKIKQYIALYDTVVPTRYQEKLWAVYGKPERLDMHSGHYSSYFYLRGVMNDIARVIQKETS
jgi:hypothetical protein